MPIDQIANIAEICAAVLVIASLIYVARQLKQTTQSMRLETVQAISSEWNRWYDSITPDEELIDVYLRGIDDLSVLNRTEQVQFILLTTRVYRTFYEQYFLWREGVMADSIWESWLAQLNDAMQYPGWQAVWSLRRHYFDEGFQSVIDRCVTEAKGVRPLYEAPNANLRREIS